MAVAQRSLSRNEPVRERRVSLWSGQTGLTACVCHAGSRPFAGFGSSVPFSFNEVPGARRLRQREFARLFPAPPELRCSNQIQAIHDESLEGRYCAVPLAISVECHLPAIVNSIAGASEVSTTRLTLDFAKEKPNDHVL